ncbi:MAG: WbqC family protein, partial [Bacteroidota bacterium]|nr:WbqC family protein [Bacteroidota bacterium]
MTDFALKYSNPKAIMHSEFFPSIMWLAFAEKQKEIIIEIYENFPKQTFRNRILLMSANGLQSISVPIERTNSPNKLLMKDAKISYKENWNIRLWRAIYSNYV